MCHFLSSVFIDNDDPSTAGIVGAPKMTSQLVSSICLFSACPLGLDEFQACPFPDVVFLPVLSASSSSPFHCALQDGFLPDLINRSCDHTTAVSFSLRWSGGLCAVLLDLGIDFLVGNMVFVSDV